MTIFSACLFVLVMYMSSNDDRLQSMIFSADLIVHCSLLLYFWSRLDQQDSDGRCKYVFYSGNMELPQYCLGKMELCQLS